MLRCAERQPERKSRRDVLYAPVRVIYLFSNVNASMFEANDF
jgi:hypothetical protein